MSLGTAWVNEVRLALLRLKDLEERVEALESEKAERTYLPSGVEVPPLPVVIELKRKPGRPRKNGN